jgi:amino-acid N-acetyltransferase
MHITEASPPMRTEIIALLQSQQLPVEDLPSRLSDFFVAQEDGKLIGLIGMEQYGEYGLLRSMVVHPDFRNKQIAADLVQTLEQRATAAGIKALYLLTETAAGYFSKKEFSTIQREEVPAVVKASSEFSHVCPVSATVMVKQLIS